MTSTMILMSVLQGLTTILIAPLVVGVIRKIKARLQGRVGAPLLQGYRDFWKWIHKNSVVSDVTSWVFRVAAFIVFGTTAAAAILIPTWSALGLSSDWLFIGFLLVLGALFLILSGMDAATTFGGMGSSREAMITALAEPAMITVLFALSATAQSTNTGDVLAATLFHASGALNPTLVIALCALFIICLAETSRYPFDNPTTHLELTMVHEAMILENSGKNLALMEWSSWTKLTILLSMIGTLIAPFGIATESSAAAIALGIVVWIVKLAVGATAIAIVESVMAKMRLLRAPMLLGMTWAIALLAILMQYFF